MIKDKRHGEESGKIEALRQGTLCRRPGPTDFTYKYVGSNSKRNHQMCAVASGIYEDETSTLLD